MSFKTLRQKFLTKTLYHWAKGVLPTMSNTEKEALEAGDVWWDAELFSGKPDWNKLLVVNKPELREDEQAFMDGPVTQLCNMVDDWKVVWEDGDLPQEVWDFMKKEKFFGMIIPKNYGGLGFTAYGHSEVIRKIATASLTAAVTVMVPNSLGPGELLMMYGTDEQRQHWLPRLAVGEEIPAFGLTSDEGGSDAAAMVDEGVVCKGQFEGKDVLGIKLNWAKRYITLGPICTVLGLAFKLRDPDNLLRHEAGEDIGITVALIPTNLPGITIGNRHLPAFQMFQNGPNQGEGVFIPIDFVIGGEANVGKGWAMLMGALAAGRGVSLPSLSAAGAAFSAHTSGAYSAIREQFKIPIGKFEGIQEVLGKMAARAYVLDAGRSLTCAGLDEGRKLAVISGIMKLHATEYMRTSMNDAMDIHGGKAVIDGPLNYLSNHYRSIPIGITVEGANILTRNMIIFGQGSIRCHPYILDEMLALENENEEEAIEQFDTAFFGHAWHTTKTFFRAWFHSWTFGLFCHAPKTGKTKKYFKQLSRYAASFSFTTDMALLTLGGSLKRREMISARLGDVLSELFLLSATLKRYEDEGEKEEDYPLVALAMGLGVERLRNALDEVHVNMPNRMVGMLLAFISATRMRHHYRKDMRLKQAAELLLTQSPTRDRLVQDIYQGHNGDGLGLLNAAFALNPKARDIQKKMKEQGERDWRKAKEQSIITGDEAAHMQRYEEAVKKAIKVDDFPEGAFKR